MQPQEGHPQTFEGTTEMIEAAAADKPVFFKDMAYYVSDVADEDFMKQVHQHVHHPRPRPHARLVPQARPHA